MAAPLILSALFSLEISNRPVNSLREYTMTSSPRKIASSCWKLLMTTSLVLTATQVSANELVEAGEAVFNGIANIGCKGCHGDYAEGDLGVGPYIRGASEGSIRAAISGIGPMTVVKDAISEDEIKAVAAYVGYLGQAQVARTQVKRGKFVPDTFSTRPGTALQIVIKNGSFRSEHSFAIEDNAQASVTVPARKTGSFLWQAPEAEGVYNVRCGNCKLKDQTFSITVSSSAPKFHATTLKSASIATDSM